MSDTVIAAVQKFALGAKVAFMIPNGTWFPGITAGPITERPHKTRNGTDILVSRVDVISLRNRIDGSGLQLRLTNETVDFGYAPRMQSRFDTVIGLDASDDGVILALQDLFPKVQEHDSEFAKTQYDLRNGATDAAAL